ncbi:hypothetical protein HMPREF1624_03063 [Sporothrix schenckii ATCC 58251]|uniref:Beta-glucuronidase C-terminal domain-containing protein n=1 Tax=Sporothrix schenckii (strain ATCC 58251 / de Perez 2211183) TaxID=1391915 RepID=U7PYZ0_SPOS1|nr:hypothetical protein HMPREF1624_03063 [Sporothrix schenckii ATCC 58251]
MKRGSPVLAWAAAARASVYHLRISAPASAGPPLLDAFVSYSIEFASFPDFAGNKSAPNTFSDALLSNLGDLTGSKPYIRVGGNTQDYALYNASLPWAINGTFNLSRSADYPTTVYIGPSFFEGYRTLPGTRFSHGFNLALATTPAGWQSLLDTVPLVCDALALESYARRRLYTWEYGNEPDLLSTSAQGPTRPTGWNESIYASQWLNGTRQIRRLIEKHCSELLREDDFRSGGLSTRTSPPAVPPDYSGFMAPSFGGTHNHLRAPAAWKAGLDADRNIALFSSHNYISGATSPGVTLQGTLMNHTNTVRSVNAHIAEYEAIFGVAAGNSTRRSQPRHILGEANSLYNEGKPGLSNTFGAALWGVDFLLYSAAAGIGRVHMHQGANYRYASWQPLDTESTTRGTKPPYYGNVAVAAALGNTQLHNVSVAVLFPSGSSSSGDVDSAYAIYVDGHLTRVLVLNLRGYNTTVDGTGLGEAAPAGFRPRPSQNYTFSLPTPIHNGIQQHVPGGLGNNSAGVLVQRLLANGSDAITGITWDGWSYNVELAGGRPVKLTNVTTGEKLQSQGGQITVSVPDSSAALLHL